MHISIYSITLLPTANEGTLNLIKLTRTNMKFNHNYKKKIIFLNGNIKCSNCYFLTVLSIIKYFAV